MDSLAFAHLNHESRIRFIVDCHEYYGTISIHDPPKLFALGLISPELFNKVKLPRATTETAATAAGVARSKQIHNHQTDTDFRELISPRKKSTTTPAAAGAYPSCSPTCRICPGKCFFPGDTAKNMLFDLENPMEHDLTADPEGIKEQIRIDLEERSYVDPRFKMLDEHLEEMWFNPTVVFQEKRDAVEDSILPQIEFEEQIAYGHLTTQDRIRYILDVLSYRRISIYDPEKLFDLDLLSKELLEKIRLPREAAITEARPVIADQPQIVIETQTDIARRNFISSRTQKKSEMQVSARARDDFSTSTDLVSLQTLRLQVNEVRVTVPSPVNMPRGMCRWLARFKDPPCAGSFYSPGTDTLFSWQCITSM
jgi:hypothetical protein